MSDQRSPDEEDRELDRPEENEKSVTGNEERDQPDTDIAGFLDSDCQEEVLSNSPAPAEQPIEPLAQSARWKDNDQFEREVIPILAWLHSWLCKRVFDAYECAELIQEIALRLWVSALA